MLSTLWANLNAAEAKGDTKASYIRNNLRILVAGGDGSATWVLGTIRELGLTPPPPVAVMPLGTGNDLSINLGWGSEFTWAWVKPDELYATLERYKNGEVCPIDVWQASITAPDATYYDAMPHSLQQDPENPRTANASFWNYFSVGLDAEAAYGFHSLREAHPRLAASRLTNQAWYGFFSCATGWFCGAPPISATLKLRVKDAPDSEWRSLVVPNSVRAIILLNLQTYGGGRDVWGLADSVGMRKQGFSEPRFNDGAIEVVGLLNGWHSALVMGQLSSKLHALRLAQCCEVELELASTRSRVKDDEATVYMQLDGEPWPQRIPAASLQRSPAVAGEGIKSSEPLRVHIASPGQSQMLLNTSNVLGSRKVKQLAKRNIDRVHSKAVNSNGADGGGAR